MARVVVYDEVGKAHLASAARMGRTPVTVGWLDRRPASFLSAGVRSGALRPTVDRVFPFADVVDAHRYLEQGQQIGNIVVARRTAATA